LWNAKVAVEAFANAAAVQVGDTAGVTAAKETLHAKTLHNHFA
jgi:hypothetical protein